MPRTAKKTPEEIWLASDEGLIAAVELFDEIKRFIDQDGDITRVLIEARG